ncbi:MAG: hypothetical protein M3237_15010 [Actinomycetota bacterium]|nr:hypothetical protein [Actinomycetota bacterium]
MVAVTVMLCLGAGAYAVVGSVMGGSSDRQAGSLGVDHGLDATGSPDSEGPSSTHETPMPTPDGRTPRGSSSEPGTPAVEQSEGPSPATGVTSPSTPVRETGPPSAGRTTRSPRPSQSSATAETARSDRSPPKTGLSTEFPAEDAALFTFSANEAASFTCSLDGAGYSRCVSPRSYADLHPGWHTFAVRATDAAGNVDPSPAEFRWLATVGGVPDS